MIQVQPRTATALDSGVWKLTPRVEWSPDRVNWTELGLLGGTVTADRTQTTRWALSVTVQPGTSPFGPLGVHPYGCHLRVFLGVQGLRAAPEYLSLGRYVVTAATDAREQATLAGASYETDVIGALFPSPRNLPGQQNQTYRGVAETLITEAVPYASFVWDPRIQAQQPMPAVTVDQDRWGTIYGRTQDASIGNALGADVYCDRNGAFAFAPVPTLQDANPVARLAWDTYQLSRANVYDRQGVYNVVVVTGQSTTDQQTIGPAYAWVSDPGSLLYAGPDPINRPEEAGAYGVKTYRYQSNALTDLRQARIAARAILANATGFNNTLTVESRFDPRIEVGDAVWVDAEDGRPVLCIIDRITYDLGTGAVSLAVRSTNGISAGDRVLTN